MAEKTSVRHYDCVTGDALYRAILDEPGDVLRRLVFADWLEEHGQLERAEFVRIQCEGCDGGVMRLWDLLNGQTDWLADLLKLTGNAASDWGVCPDGAVDYEGKYRRGEFWVRNGFVDEVRCPLGWWAGNPCLVCQGTGLTGGLSPSDGCAACGGAVVARHPRHRVPVTDLEPWHHRRIGDSTYFWFDADYYGKPASVLPPAVYSAVRRVLGITRQSSRIEFLTPQDAHAALSDAVVDLAREAAGLRQLVRKVEVTS